MTSTLYRLTPEQIIEVADDLLPTTAEERGLVVYAGMAYARGEHGICRPLITDLEQNRYLSTALRGLGFDVEETALRRVFKTFMARTAPLGERVPPVALGDEPGDCLVRIRPPKEGDWSAWEEFTGRLDAPDSFRAWVWSIFELRHGGRQMLWLRGDGHDGKTKVARVLAAALGTAAGVLDDERLGGDGKRFALASIWDKRLVVVPDTKVRTLAMGGLLHQLSGGDVMFIEGKGLQGFSAQPDVRLLIASNEHPAVTRNRSNTSRLLPIEVGPRPTYRSDPTWEHRLREQLPAFLAECRRAYTQLCPEHGDIPLEAATAEALDLAAGELEDQHLHVAETLGLVPDGSAYVPLKDLMAAADAQFPALARNSNAWGDFKRWLRGTIQREAREGRPRPQPEGAPGYSLPGRASTTRDGRLGPGGPARRTTA